MVRSSASASDDVPTETQNNVIYRNRLLTASWDKSHGRGTTSLLRDIRPGGLSSPRTSYLGTSPSTFKDIRPGNLLPILLVTYSGDHWRPVQTCSYGNPPSPSNIRRWSLKLEARKWAVCILLILVECVLVIFKHTAEICTTRTPRETQPIPNFKLKPYPQMYLKCRLVYFD